MTIQEAKQISIADYLQSLGYSPVKQQGESLWYKSPFRQETEASFKVNTNRNLWFDYGLGKRRQHHRTGARTLFLRPCALSAWQDSGTGTTHPSHIFLFSPAGIRTEFPTLEVGELTHPALLRYLQERGINIALAKAQCKELHFTHNGKPISPSVFRMWRGGFEVRNRFFQRLCRTQRHQPYSATGRSEREMPCIRGHDGLSFIPHVAEEELLELARP